jgi:2-phosphoglycerate kinase
MPRKRQTQHIVVSDRAGLPYSKGLMASSIMATGLAPFRAYEVAERIEEELLSTEKYEVTRDELRDLTIKTISSMVGQRYADTYRNWQSVEELDLPLIILIGGTTGVGKSTIATQLAARLGITRIISTDAVREVMRSLFSERIMPTLHTASFVPGFIGGAWEDKAVVVSIVITVDDEDVHRSHFFLRASEAGQRNVERYLTSFGDIRKVQKYIRSAAQQHSAPVISSYSLDATLASVIDHIVENAVRRTQEASGSLSATS